MNSTSREMQKLLGVEGREQWQEVGRALSLEENISWEAGADGAASTLCKALLTAKPERQDFSETFFL